MADKDNSGKKVRFESKYLTNKSGTSAKNVRDKLESSSDSDQSQASAGSDASEANVVGTEVLPTPPKLRNIVCRKAAVTREFDNLVAEGWGRAKSRNVAQEFVEQVLATEEHKWSDAQRFVNYTAVRPRVFSNPRSLPLVGRESHVS
ncbi:hypothetical protein HRG_010561 [Hirsutella rhossiliensis]|uniref:Uncharacterized protein n=1 Tax=Hirsutella rhossiliensis TaxID=111463 RepID=A0A9P8MND6_9HYPO|nr:uncharacterized protein HRG_10561 [Hirsutella rhossiliensis]KAH0958260.1 hypothetical protein HRG_10561 [Hirsutella rhossiliensis]